MRKMMTKEVTTTTVKVAKMVVVDGLPQVEQLPDEVLMGNVSAEKAQKIVTKKHGAGTSIFGVEPNTQVYELEVEEFIKHARLKTDDEEVASEEEENEE